MREFIFISHLFLSLLFIATPTLGLNFQLNYQAQEEMMCCVDIEADSNSTDAKSCHEDDIASQHSCKDKCQDHAAHVVTHSIEPPYQNAEISIKEEISSLKQSSYYQDLFQQHFTLTFWNPPKQA